MHSDNFHHALMQSTNDIVVLQLNFVGRLSKSLSLAPFFYNHTYSTFMVMFSCCIIGSGRSDWNEQSYLEKGVACVTQLQLVRMEGTPGNITFFDIKYSAFVSSECLSHEHRRRLLCILQFHPTVEKRQF